jgi:hypothetical protein
MDSGIKRAFGSVNKFKRQKKQYSRRLGLDQNKNNSQKDDG